MRSSIRRSSKLYKSSAILISSTTPRSYYSSGSSTSSSSGGSNNNNNNDLNSQFSQLYQHFTAELKGHQNPSFSDMVSAVTNSAALREKISQFTNIASGGAYGNAKPVRIAVTGAAGAIAYSLLFRLAAGELLGQRPIILQCLEISKALPALEGVKMELKDCAFPLLQDIITTDDANKAFEGAEYIFMVGAFPRSKGMDRSQLLQMNAGIFSAQGKAINKAADRNVKTLVVGNPANTNCLIAAYNAPDISPTQFSAMTRLDHNRGISQLADRTNAKVSEIEKFAIWGNHSDTQFPDISNTVISGKPAKESITDDAWVKNTFIPTVAKRGAAIIAARGTSSAASAANAAIDQMKDWALGSSGKWVSMAVWTGDKGEKVPYGDQGVGSELFYSYPVICEGGKYTIVEGLKMDEDGKKRLKATNEELEKERSDAGLGHRK